MNERDLLVDFKKKREALEIATEAKTAAQKEFDAAEMRLIEHLTNIGAESTASYDGLGYAKMSKPQVYASCLKENEDKLKEKLKEMGRTDIIKETIHPRSLSSLVGELLADGKQPPDVVKYYLKTNVRVY